MSATKKLFDAALGMVTAANEAWKKNLDELIEKGKITREEGESLIDNLENKVAEGKKQFEAIAKNMMDKVNKSFSEKEDTPDKEKTNTLEDRVKSLELKISLLIREMAALKDEISARTTKKSTATRTSRKKPTSQK